LRDEASDPSIERTAESALPVLSAAVHVERVGRYQGRMRTTLHETLGGPR
jgi:hypothetical protein